MSDELKIEVAHENEADERVEDAAENTVEADVDKAADAAEDAAGAADEAIDADGDEDEDEELDSEDSLTYSNGVIEKIVAIATREADHVLGMKGNLMHFVQETLGAENLTKGVSVEVTDDNRVIVNISVIIEYGAYAPAIFEDVKTRVTERLESMTGLEVAGINLRIEDVMTREEYAASHKHAQENAE
ncbi:Asp23/Gls24 family envelope stress response protein [Collinsella tanakaei]|uniref:Asp23/Gls24 family envelope stress response protein n=1 Tax=Collinsella tanakaei TaxID=626935 RepID=UPI0025A3B5D5|nr:Asp23/Gls24 family envelope stress response protein [Collinsella tanakaei]MDM8301775.1 Asp23/Gls24 family envelope stress response protein [Collinsella tanakaei]